MKRTDIKIKITAVIMALTMILPVAAYAAPEANVRESTVSEDTSGESDPAGTSEAGISEETQPVDEVSEVSAEDRVITLEEKGSLEEAIESLPDSWTVTLEDGTEKEVDITWECKDDFDEDYTSFVFQGSIDDEAVLSGLSDEDKDRLTMEIYFESEVKKEEAPEYSEIPVYESELSPNTIIPEIESEQGTDEVSEDFKADFNGSADEVIEVLQSNETDNAVLSDSVTDIFKSISPTEDNYLYAQLTDDEKALYNKIDALVTQYLYYGKEFTTINGRSITAYCDAGNLTKDEAKNVRAYYYANNPQAFFLSTSYYISTNPLTGSIKLAITAYPDADTPAEVKSKAQEIAGNISALEEEINEEATDYEKAKKAYELLCGYVAYDNESLTTGSADWEDWGPGNLSYNQSIISVFSGTRRQTVCAGYAKSYTALMRAAGLDAFSVTSSSHEWNKSELYGKWYGTDATWGDQSRGVDYSYLLKSDTTLKSSGDSSAHIPESQWNGMIPASASDYDTSLPAHSHSWNTVVTKATPSTNGSVKKVCTECGKTEISSVIYYPKTFNLKAASYVYNGKARKPGVTIKGSDGNAIAASNYTVTYSNNIKAGKATVTVKFRGNYSGTKKLYFTILPKGTSLKSLTASSGGFTVKWKKQAVQTTGYQIQYSTDSGFESNKKTITVSKPATVSKTISKLKSKQKYYVRIRTFVKVGSTKYYSAWSGSKSVKTK